MYYTAVVLKKGLEPDCKGPAAVFTLTLTSNGCCIGDTHFGLCSDSKLWCAGVSSRD